MDDLEDTLCRLEGASNRLDKLQLLRELTRETARWREVAIYLADCHAATAEYDGSLRSTSHARRQRLAGLCTTAAKMLAGTYVEGKPVRNIQSVIDRLVSTAGELFTRGKP